MNALLHRTWTTCASAAAAMRGPEPLEGAVHLNATWMDPHMTSFDELKRRARSFIASESRARFLTRGPALQNLSVCGALLVPFGGAMLSDFEAHLRGFVIRDFVPAQPRDDRSSGFQNVVDAYEPAEADARVRLGGLGPLVLRSSRASSRASCGRRAPASTPTGRRACRRQAGCGRH